MNDQVVILPNRCTFPELVGKDYPYLFDTMDQQIAIMRKLIKEGIKEYKHHTKPLLKLSNHAGNIHKYFTQLGIKSKQNLFDSIKKQASKNKIAEYLEHQLKQLLNEFGYDYNINLDKYIK